MEFVQLGVDRNAGFALLGENIQEGQAQFVTIECIAPVGSEEWKRAARKAADKAFKSLETRQPDRLRLIIPYFGRSHPDYQPNLNTGKTWSETELADLQYALEDRSSIPLIADSLGRDPEEVYEKVNELRGIVEHYL
jgi:hypothetical protein